MSINPRFYSTCVLSGTVQNLHLKCASSLLRAIPVASTQWCTFQTGFLALALLDAARLAFAGNKLPADLGCLGERCPERFLLSCGNQGMALALSDLGFHVGRIPLHSHPGSGTRYTDDERTCPCHS